MQRRWTCWMLVAVLAALALPAAAQQQTSVTGLVKDTEGGVLPGVTVTVRNQATGLTRTAYTSGDGRFGVTGLPPGTYTVTASLQGFADFQVTDLKLLVGTVAPIAAVMQPAAVARTVTVTGERTIVETTESDVSTAISQELIESLPIAERNAITLALLVPGVSASPYFDPTKSRDNFDGVSFGGGSGSENLVLVDGGDNNDDVVGSILQFYPQESIQEFEVISSRFKAEYGHTDGGVVNMITRSGTNTLSGGGYWLFRDDALNKRTFVEKETGSDKGEFRQNIAGGYLGGPLAQDRLFFFGNADYTKRPQQLLLNTGGVIPEIDGEGQVPQDFEQTLGVGKLTANLGTRNFLTARYAYQDDQTSNVNVIPTASTDTGGLGTNTYHAVLVKDQTVIGGDMLNEAFWQFNTFTNEIVSNAIGRPLENRSLLIDGGTYALGQNLNHPQLTEQDKHQFVDTFSWRMTGAGDHDLKAGVEVQRVRVGGMFTSGDPFAVFSWASVDDWRAGRPADSVAVTNGPAFFVGESLNHVFSLFVQDDWKPTERLTLNLGLRYDLETNDWTQDPDKGRLGPGRTFITADPLFFGAQPGTDSNNLGPRLGFAYDVEGDGDLVVRGGYGVYYQQIFWNSPIRYPFFEGDLISGLDFTGAEVTFDPSQPFCAAGTSGPGCIPVPELPRATASDFLGSPALTGPDPGMKTPWTHQMSIGFSTLLPADIGFDADFVRTFSDSQIYRTRVAGRSTIGGLDVSRFNLRSLIDLNGAEQSYRGLLLAARRRFDRMSMQVSYTWSRAEGHIARQTSALIVDSDAGFEDNFGPNFGQRDHLFAGSVSYTLPWEVEIGTIVKLQSGYAFTALDTSLGDRDGDNRATDTIADRALGSPGGSGRRGEFRGDSFSQVDLRLSKSFTIAGRYRPQVFVEVFNLFDARNEKPDSVVTSITNPLFGTSSQVAGQPFQAQLSVRLDF